MSNGINVITANFSTGGRQTLTRKLYQYDYGQKIFIYGLKLPSTFEVHISNDNNANTAQIYIGKDNEIEIPDKYLTSGENIYLWIFLHSTAADGETRYIITIPVQKKPKPIEEQPTPVEKDTIDQFIAALEDNLNEMQKATIDAKEKMQVAINKANNTILKYPKIIENYWYVYDTENETWINTEIKALGEDGVGIKNIVFNDDYTLTIVFTNDSSYTTSSIRGKTGLTPNITIGRVENLSPNENPYVTKEGTIENPIFNFGLVKGEKGDTGAKGDAGERGPQGPQGEKGETGAQGETGAAGQKGDPFTYSDFTPEQLAALVGPQGPKGDKGDKGDQGIQGPRGEKGATGEQGVQGEKGQKGDTGATGPQGPAGASGKSAYEYAQDGGYTGTEAQFAEKLADDYVSSVNGSTGAVVLTASDVNALPSSTVIPTVPTNVSAFNNDAGYATETWVTSQGYTEASTLATVATTGSYNDLSDTPTIPTVPVDSVNGKTGVVVLTASDVGALASNTTYVSSFNGSSGAITYSAPVDSVNGQTGAVVISEATTSVAGLMSATDKANLDAVYADYSAALIAVGS